MAPVHRKPSRVDVETACMMGYYNYSGWTKHRGENVTEPDVGTKWAHCRGGRVCKVVGNRITHDKHNNTVRLVEYRYVRTAGGMGQNRTTPTQTMELSAWRGLFTKSVP